MKKNLSLLLAIGLALSLSLTACSEKKTAETPKPSSPSVSSSAPSESAAAHDPVTDPQFDTKELLLSTSSSTSSYYIVGVGLSDLLNAKNYGFTMSATTSGGSVDNINRIASGEAELGSGMPDAVYYAANGMNDWEGKPVAVAPLCALWSNPLNVVVRADSGITDISQLAGKTVSTGAAGTGSQGLPFALLQAYGIDPEKGVSWKNGTIAEQCDMLKDGQIDAIMFSMGMGNASFTDLATSTDVVWLSVPDDMLDAALEIAPFYAKVVIPAGTYPGIESDVNCLGFNVSLYASTERVSEDQAYLICKTIFDDPTALATYHSAAKDISLDTCLGGIATDLHPGAEKYFREIGVLK